MIMPFGKYMGMPIVDVDPEYLLWLYKQDWLKTKYRGLYNYIKRNKKRIQTQADFNAIEEVIEDCGMEYRHSDWGDRDY